MTTWTSSTRPSPASPPLAFQSSCKLVHCTGGEAITRGLDLESFLALATVAVAEHDAWAGRLRTLVTGSEPYDPKELHWQFHDVGTLQRAARKFAPQLMRSAARAVPFSEEFTFLFKVLVVCESLPLACEMLRATAHSPLPRVRAYGYQMARLSLGRDMGRVSRLAPILRAALSDPDPEVRLIVVGCLRGLERTQHRRPTATALADILADRGGDREVRQAAARQLQMFRDAESRALFDAFADDADPVVREIVRSAGLRRRRRKARPRRG